MTEPPARDERRRARAQCAHWSSCSVSCAVAVSPVLPLF